MYIMLNQGSGIGSVPCPLFASVGWTTRPATPYHHATRSKESPRPMCRSLLFPGALSLALLLAGCALPIEPDDPQPVLGPEEFALRMDRLEADLAARCEIQRVTLSDQARRQEVLVADVREVGSLLRSEERRVGKEWRARGSPDHEKKKRREK